MKCTECPYYWADTEEQEIRDAWGVIDTILVEIDGVKYCHYRWDDGDAPCERMEQENA